jgi:NAD(P)-dependent dehydrogenase (short-subunit alcohol dehydrogenase family)
VEIKGKVAVVTGAARRVGRVIALSLAEKGAHVAFTYHTSKDHALDLREAIQSCGVEALALPMDVSQPDQARAVMQQVVDHFSRLDLLVNNASTWLGSPFLEITAEQWNSELAINLSGPFFCSQAAASHMLRQQSGVIINITDLSAFQTWPRFAHHSAAKAGLVALTKVMAAELAPNVRVNAIAPGTVLLPENATEAKRQWAIDRSLLKRVGTPQDVARTVNFLVEMDFVTGAVYFVDGGRALV